MMRTVFYWKRILGAIAVLLVLMLALNYLSVAVFGASIPPVLSMVIGLAYGFIVPNVVELWRFEW